jgi:hypothetical protein
MNIHDNIFNRKFTALQLSTWFEKNFPNASGVHIYKGAEPCNRNTASRVWQYFSTVDQTGYVPKKRFTICATPECPEELTLSRDLYFFTNANYISNRVAFTLEDNNRNAYTVRWYCESQKVSEDYISTLAKLIFVAFHQKENPPYESCLVACRNYYVELNEIEMAAKNNQPLLLMHGHALTL